MIIIWLLAILFVLVSGVNWYMIRWVRLMLDREKQMGADRNELVNFLNRVVGSVASTSQPEEWLENVASELAKTLSAEGLWVYFQRDGMLHLATRTGPITKRDINSRNRFRKSARYIEHLNRATIEIGDGLIGEVALTGRSKLLLDVEESGIPHGEDLRIDSLLAVPIILNHQVIGVICAVNKTRPHAVYTPDDRFLLESLSSQVALGNTITQVYDSLSEQQRLEQELKMAMRIQDSLLPKGPPTDREFQIYADYQPALEVGGDYYDFINIDEHFLLVVVADASGKGIPACMLMSMCRSFLRSNAGRFKENLEGLFLELNSNIHQDTDGSQFVTMACCLIDRRDQTVEYARAGHTELVIRPPNGEDVVVIQPDGPALGLLPNDMDVHFDTFQFSWLPGSSLLLFTDGITEATNEDEQQYGLDAVIETWCKQDFEPQAAAIGIRNAVEKFTGKRPQTDDQTIVVMTRPPASKG